MVLIALTSLWPFSLYHQHGTCPWVNIGTDITSVWLFKIIYWGTVGIQDCLPTRIYTTEFPYRQTPIKHKMGKHSLLSWRSCYHMLSYDPVWHTNTENLNAVWMSSLGLCPWPWKEVAWIFLRKAEPPPLYYLNSRFIISRLYFYKTSVFKGWE